MIVAVGVRARASKLVSSAGIVSRLGDSLGSATNNRGDRAVDLVSRLGVSPLAWGVKTLRLTCNN